MIASSLLALAAAQLASAHFGLTYPEWRADTLKGTNVTGYSQWKYPCAGVPYGAGNITDWPVDGGSIELDLHHDWTYLFINVGVGANTTVFNITLPQLWNVTGSGTLCVEKLPLPSAVPSGTLGSIQIVTSGESGSALYNCADIRFSDSAKVLSGDQCKTNGTKLVAVMDATANTTNTTAPPPSAAAGTHVSMVALSSVVGLSIAFAAALSL